MAAGILVKFESGSYGEGRARPKKEAVYRLEGGRFNKQGNWPTRLVLGSHKTSGSPHLPTRIVKVCIEALPGLQYYPDGLNT